MAKDPNVHRTVPSRCPPGHRSGIGRAPCDAPHYWTEPGAYRPDAGRHPAGLLRGSLRFHSTNFHRAPPVHRPGAVAYVTTNAIERKIVRDPYGL